MEPGPIDRYVGSRLRSRRLLVCVSQQKLADALGVTFQQIQKYEKGTNRISASRLQLIARLLDVPVSFFFDGGPSNPPTVLGVSNEKWAVEISDLLETSEGVRLARSFARIHDKNIRRRVVDLISSLAEDEEDME